MPIEIPGPTDGTLSLDQMRAIDEVCGRFENAWREANPDDNGPEIEPYLADLSDPHRSALVRELVRIDLYYRHQRGTPRTADDYRARFPGLDPSSLETSIDGSGPSGDETVEQPRTPWSPTQVMVPTGPRPLGPESVPFPDLPRYEILEELGRGGMGIVYKARQVGLDRLVALKMIRAGVHASPEELDRFRAEGLAVARLRHPQIVQIFDVGEYQGWPYFALELLEGESLRGKLGGAPMPPREAAELAVQLARGIAAAHAQRIVHRDLKPANILFTQDGQPKITDFGLAKQLEVDEHQTRTGAVMGTPSYMAPEQAWGHTDRIGPAADIYALGALLYAMLTGRPPFQGAAAIDILDQVRHNEPVAPSQLVPKLPRDLETITLKALQKDPARRYTSAEALADELQRYLDGKPILARPVSSAERAWRWARRNPWVAGLSSALALLLGTSAVGFGVLSYRLNEKKNEALTQKTKAEEARKQADDNYKEALEQNNMALNAVRGAIEKVDTSLRGIPGMLPRAIAP